jgi:hypothetical protein
MMQGKDHCLRWLPPRVHPSQSSTVRWSRLAPA